MFASTLISYAIESTEMVFDRIFEKYRYLAVSQPKTIFWAGNCQKWTFSKNFI